MKRAILVQLLFLFLAVISAVAGTTANEYKILPPITEGNLSLFPVVGGQNSPTAELLTLDEGLRSGAVIVTEAGSLRGLLRRGTHYERSLAAEVNRLVLVNNSDRPLLLLAGEVVTGGK
jgi:hypothetical protein